MTMTRKDVYLQLLAAAQALPQLPLAPTPKDFRDHVSKFLHAMHLARVAIESHEELEETVSYAERLMKRVSDDWAPDEETNGAGAA